MEDKQDSATPAQGQQVISACAFIHKNFDGVTKVFLPKRADTKKFLPGVYELPGGHIDFGEDVIDGLKREIQEELNMTVTVGDPFYVYTYENHLKGSHTIQAIYFAQFEGPTDHITLRPQDHSTYGWFTKEEVVKLADEIRGNQTMADAHLTHDYADDPELLTMIRGFELLEGAALKFK